MFILHLLNVELHAQFHAFCERNFTNRPILAESVGAPRISATRRVRHYHRKQTSRCVLGALTLTQSSTYTELGLACCGIDEVPVLSRFHSFQNFSLDDARQHVYPKAKPPALTFYSLLQLRSGVSGWTYLSRCRGTTANYGVQTISVQ